MPSHDQAIAPQGRKRPRHRAHLSGVVTYNDGVHSFPCTIRNLADDGARISLSERHHLPPRMYLINVRDEIAYEALTVWVGEGEAGVAFLDRLPLREVTDKNLTYLKRLRQGGAPRHWAPEDP